MNGSFGKKGTREKITRLHADSRKTTTRKTERNQEKMPKTVNQERKTMTQSRKIKPWQREREKKASYVKMKKKKKKKYRNTGWVTMHRNKEKTCPGKEKPNARTHAHGLSAW